MDIDVKELVAFAAAGFIAAAIYDAGNRFFPSVFSGRS